MWTLYCVFHTWIILNCSGTVYSQLTTWNHILPNPGVGWGEGGVGGGEGVGKDRKRVDQWEALTWSWDLRANGRPQKQKNACLLTLFWQYSLTQMRVTILSLQEIVVSSSVLKILNGHCNVGTILCWSHILNCPGTVYIQHHTYDPILLGSIGHPFLLVSVGSLKPGRFPAHFRIDNRVLPYWHLVGI